MIKKICNYLVIVTGIFVIAGTALARDNVDYWYIKDFQSEIVVNKDSSLDITEHIVADCGVAQGKHGIFRVLPKNYKTTNETFILPTEVISVTDFDNNNVNYELSQDSDTLTVKIGSAGITVSGVNNYIIKYHVKNAIRTGNERFDELYWNLSGNYWDIDVDNFAAKVIMPEGVTKNNSEINYYVGALDSQEIDVKNFHWISDNVVEFLHAKTMTTGEGVTASISFPKNIVTPHVLTREERGELDPVVAVVGSIALLMIPLLTFFFSWRLWRKHGDDPRFEKTIIPEFEIPENLSPMEMGGIMEKGGFRNSFITASIIHLAVLGYVKIEETVSEVLFFKTKEYKFLRTEKELGDDLHKAESLLLDKIFASGKKEVLFSDLKNKFYAEIPDISDLLEKDLRARGLVTSGVNYQMPMVIFGIFFGLAGLMVTAIFWPVGLSLLFSGLSVLTFGAYMPKRSLVGTELNWRIEGFKLYMNTAEKYREQFNERENIMEKLLPYAVLFGMTKEWLKKMKDIYGEQYLTTHQPAFLLSSLPLTSFDSFADNLSVISNSITSHVSSSPSGSGGGGSSGGGGGGGGGGGW